MKTTQLVLKEWVMDILSILLYLFLMIVSYLILG